MRPADFARGRPREFALPREESLLRARYRGLGRPESFDGIFAHAASLNATHVLLEHEYLDRDYRDEYSNFYTKTLRWVPDRCERLHFWAGFIYIGYCSIRPIKGRPIGRTMLAPGRELEDYVSCVMPAQAHPYGHKLSVPAFPFISQDGQYGSCAHAVIWMICRYHRHVNGAREWLMSDIVKAAAQDEAERVVPSGGLTDEQIGSVFRRLELDAVRYNIRLGEHRKPSDMARQAAKGKPTSTPTATEPPPLLTVAQVEGIVLRYLNSRIPLALCVQGHTTALIGAKRASSGDLEVVCCDDQRAPYTLMRIDLSDGKAGWEVLFVPLPETIFLLGEQMTRPATKELVALIRKSEEAAAMLAGRTVRTRAYVVESTTYKMGLARRGMPAEAAKAHVQVATARWIWVLELQDENLARSSRDCVLGEIAVDATSDAYDMTFLFANLPGLRARWRRDYVRPTRVLETAEDFEPYETGTALNL